MIFESLRQKIAGILLRRKAARVKRQKMLFDFASASYIGVLCAPQNETDTAHLKAFLQYLSRKNIHYSVLGYFDAKEIPENFLYWKSIDAFTQLDLDFFFMPNSPVVSKFISEPFDMLINCDINGYFQLDYVAQLSVAKCKTGVMHKNELYSDLMIDISKLPTIEYFLKNLELYLANLRQSTKEQT